MAVQFPQISADTISGIGDPWVAEAHKARVQGILAQSGGDYRKAAMALMSIDPASAAQLIKLSGQQQAAGQHAESLAIQRAALDKPTVHYDENTGRFFEYRPKGPAGTESVKWLTEAAPRVAPGQTGQNPPPPDPSVPPVPQQSVVPRTTSPDTSLPPLPPGMTRESIRRMSTKTPQEKAIWETNSGQPPGTADRLIKAYGSGASLGGTGASLAAYDGGADDSDPEAQAGGMPGGGAPSQFPGGIMRTAGSEQDLPPEISQAFAQAGPGQRTYNQGRTQMPTPPGPGQPFPPPPQPAPGQQYPLKPKDLDTYNLDMAKEQGKLDMKERQSKQQAAEKAMPFVRLSNQMTQYAAEANKAGLANNFMQAAPIRGMTGLARGVWDTFAPKGQEAPGMIGATKWQDLYEQGVARMQLIAAEAFKGQGAITDAERTILVRGLPPLNLMNTTQGRAMLDEYRETLYNVIRRGGYDVPGVD